MKIIHSFQGKHIQKTVSDASFILNNNKGGYAYFSDSPKSRYQGFFIYEDGKMFKSINEIFVNDKSVTEIKNSFHQVQRKKGNSKELFFVPHNTNSLVYELDTSKKVTITLDCKESYDNRVWGRFYSIHEEAGCIIVTFTKKTDNREDSSHDVTDYCVYIAIKSDSKRFKELNNWLQEEYSEDTKRDSRPFFRFVYQAISITCNKVVISTSTNKELAIAECKSVFSSTSKLKTEKKKYVQSLVKKASIPFSKIKNNELKFAAIGALCSLDGLIVERNERKRVLAGLPWFYQLWSRDELISLKGLFIMKNFTGMIDALVSNLNNIDFDRGTVLTNDQSDFLSADALGWLFVRFHDLSKKSSIHSFVSKQKMDSLGKLILKNQAKNDYIVNGSKETWMDSIERAGARIEMQALMLATYHFLYKTTKERRYKQAEEQLKKQVVEGFWNRAFLYDGINDTSVRPNVFIAYYVYPQLLTKEEWKQCFHYMLPHLLTDFGGLTTIDKENPQFHANHTGEQAYSYHNGDSWYWINNLAALCLYRADKKKFHSEISSILEASVHEILWSGAIGHHAEISSASRLESQGCAQQAWSNALFIELVHELFS